MRAVLLGDQTEQLIADRHRLDQDRYDEIWEGEYHVAPLTHGHHGLVQVALTGRIAATAKERNLLITGPLNIGTLENCRVPDFAVHHAGTVLDVWNPTAALIGEVLSPGDETWQKFHFYWEHRVEEILVADYERRTVQLFERTSEISSDYPFREVDSSDLLGLSTTELADIDWPCTSP